MTTQKTIPANACYFNAGEVALELDGDPLSTRVSLLARSSQPIDHWHWGRVVHDLAGVQLSKPKIPIDYAHNSDEVIGFLDSIEVDEAGLRTDGQLVVFNDDDRAAEVAYKSAQGVPYEASINFGGDGIKLEQVDAGESTEVNGYEFEGPGVVVRSWPLRGVAIVPYGADQNTETNTFHKSGEIAVEFLTKGNEMAARKRKKPAAEKFESATIEAPVEDQVAEHQVAEDQIAEDQADEDQVDVDGSAEAVEEIIADAEAAKDDKKDDKKDDQAEKAPADDVKLKPKFTQAEGERFVAEFGEIGASWFVEGISFEQAQERQLSQLKETLDQLKEENAELRQRLGAAEFGEADGVEFSNAPAELGNNAAIFESHSKHLPRAAAAFATRFEVERNGNGRA